MKQNTREDELSATQVFRNSREEENKMGLLEFWEGPVKCPKDGKEMTPSKLGLLWSCECGVTARFVTKRGVDPKLKMGFHLQSLAQEGKRIIKIYELPGGQYLIFEEPK